MNTEMQGTGYVLKHRDAGYTGYVFKHGDAGYRLRV